MDELWDQTKAVYNPVAEVPPKKFSKQIAFNVIPHIDVFLDSGETKEEWKMVAETKKILDPSIKVTATCVRVPVFVGHSEAINIETEEFLDWQEAQDILREAPGVMLVDKREPGWLHHADRMRGGICHLCQPRAAGFDHGERAEPVVRRDNLRKGAALNAVQIAELLGNRVLKKGLRHDRPRPCQGQPGRPALSGPGAPVPRGLSGPPPPRPGSAGAGPRLSRLALCTRSRFAGGQTGKAPT
jgi:aspartate-semialdehyde dehydrogenase